MRPVAFMVIGWCAIGAPASAAAQAGAADSTAVVEVVRRFHEALVRGDSGTALSLLADDAVVLEAGSLETREDYRAHHLPADIRFAAAVRTTQQRVRVRLAGDVAWVASSAEVVGTFEGRSVNSVSAELAVLARGARGWLIRAIHWSSRRREPG